MKATDSDKAALEARCESLENTLRQLVKASVQFLAAVENSPEPDASEGYATEEQALKAVLFGLAEFAEPAPWQEAICQIGLDAMGIRSEAHHTALQSALQDKAYELVAELKKASDAKNGLA
jgi:hypothetical protein